MRWIALAILLVVVIGFDRLADRTVHPDRRDQFDFWTLPLIVLSGIAGGLL
ncbi:hypothetical protein [Brevundimonas sp. BAL3]|uniref:hypothetical protein n=1 Tax=Brevundimonas sp. BAL3 TaxID=391600 RepID=UPI0012E99C3E|nr:hypothetical protein [Brevundimonas sp. BAL3]